MAVGARRLSMTVLVARLLAGRYGDTVVRRVRLPGWSGATHDTLRSLTASLADPAGQHELIAIGE